jgi:hypothetical protein
VEQPDYQYAVIAILLVNDQVPADRKGSDVFGNFITAASQRGVGGQKFEGVVDAVKVLDS